MKTSKSSLTSLVDVIQEDVSGSSTRRKYQHFITGGLGPGVTSSIFQTVYDQSFELQTANALFDLTVGLHKTSSIVVDASTGEDSAGKLLFPSKSLMMREKVNLYRQFAQKLLGDADAQFVAPFGSSNHGDGIDAAMFMSVKRLFARDQMKRETLAVRFYQSASRGDTSVMANPWGIGNRNGTNLNQTSVSGSTIFTDVGSATNKQVTYGGQVSDIVDSANTNRKVGLLFNDAGVLVFDLAKILSATQKVSGTIDAVTQTSLGVSAGQHVIGGFRSENRDAKFIPDLMVSASIDNIVDHLASTRFSSGTLTAMAFQNVTNINSTLIFCRCSADEFNYSSNPTYVDTENRIVVIDPGQEDTQVAFSFVTGIGLYDANDNLLAVAKLSRPVEKNNERDLTFRVRLDFVKRKTSQHILVRRTRSLSSR